MTLYRLLVNTIVGKEVNSEESSAVIIKGYGRP